VEGLPPTDQPAAISEAALHQRCSKCRETLEMFVEAFGAEAGTWDCVASPPRRIRRGGIAPKILAALQDGRFMDAFRAKAPMTELVSAMPWL
jgi:glucokinase